MLAGQTPARLLRSVLGASHPLTVAPGTLPTLLMELMAVCERRHDGIEAAASAPAASAPPAQLVRPLPAALRFEHAALLKDALGAPHLLPQPHGGAWAGGPAPLDFGKVVAPARDDSPYASLLPTPPPRVLYRSTQVQNTGQVPVMLLSLRLEPPSDAYGLFDDHGIAAAESPAGVLLPPGASYEVTVQLSCGAGAAGGVLSAWLLCTLAALGDAPSPFVLGRRVIAVVLSEAQSRAVSACFAFNPDARPFVPARLRTLFDIPTPRFCAHAALGAVPGAWLHANSTVVLPSGELEGAHEATRAAFCSLARMLRLEEAAQTRALRAYDCFDAVLDASDRPAVFRLGVPGLPEARPALSMGDAVHLRHAASPHDVEFVAVVVAVDVRGAAVEVEVPPECARMVGATLHMHCRVALDRSLFVRMSAALRSLETCTDRPAVLPECTQPPYVEPPQPHLRKDVAARSAMLNKEQCTGVMAVLNGHADGVPHVLHGPPGTGKTLTVVETARQLLLTRPHANLLLCAPSPFAADILCSRLSAIVPDAGILRVSDPRRAAATVKDDVLPFCASWLDAQTIEVPSRVALAGLRVVIATCASAALLQQLSAVRSLLPFDAVLIDEAGQATAPETLIALAPPLATSRTAILLAGDPRQLGPVVHSRAAATLSSSLLERFAAAATSRAEDGRRRITQLMRNYRSHADVLALPSQLFYDSALVPCADAATTSLPGAWLGAHDGGRSRVHFHGVRGTQQRDADAPSWYNALEAAAVADVVAGLLSHGLQMHDIGVIATFRRQVIKIRHLLRSQGLGAIRVGTVDDYQGQQERVMVISTVISRVGSDASADEALGFLANPRRFNVAVSRAQALNIVVGHPVPLATWPHWHALLRHALARGTYTGAGAATAGDADTGLADELAAAVARLAELTLLGSADHDGDASHFDDFYGDERGWKVAL